MATLIAFTDAGGDNPWAGLLFIVLVLLATAAALLIGVRIGRSNSVSERVHRDAVEGGKTALMRKMRYKNLAEDYQAQADAATSIVDYIRATRPSPDLDKVARVLKGFDRLAQRNADLHRKTADIDLSEFKDDP